MEPLASHRLLYLWMEKRGRHSGILELLLHCPSKSRVFRSLLCYLVTPFTYYMVSLFLFCIRSFQKLSVFVAFSSCHLLSFAWPICSATAQRLLVKAAVPYVIRANHGLNAYILLIPCQRFILANCFLWPLSCSFSFWLTNLYSPTSTFWKIQRALDSPRVISSSVFSWIRYNL